VRPFGAAFLIAGVDPDGTVRLFETDPSGAVVQYKASAIGVGRAAALEFLENEYRLPMDQDHAIKLGLKALYRLQDSASQPVVGGEPTVDISVVSVKDGYRQLTPDEVKRHLQASQQAWGPCRRRAEHLPERQLQLPTSSTTSGPMSGVMAEAKTRPVTFRVR